jgi:feruloyl esterase
VLWFGLPRGADFGGLSGTQGNPPSGRPNPITLEWFRFFLTQNPQWDWTTINRGSYEQLWDQSVEQFSAVIATDNPDLGRFRDRGGRIVMWHGQSDPLIYPGGSIDYFTRVTQQMGGAARTSEFLRFFLAPGVGHCGGGAGPAPTGQLSAVIDWVENGKAPDTLLAVRHDQTGASVRSRPLCQYPLVARYTGQGSTDDAATFVCRTQ